MIETDRLVDKEGFVVINPLYTTALSNPKIAVFLITAPHDEPDRGDTDYVKCLVKGLEKYENIILEHVTGETHMNGHKLYDVSILNSKEGKKGLIYKQKDNEIRKQAVANMLEYIKSKANDGFFKIMHLQLRAPETGCMIHTEEINNFKNSVNKFVITCHEWTHNKKTKGSRINQIQQLEYIQYADHTFFLNEADRNDAVISAKMGFLTSEDKEPCATIEDLQVKSSVSNVIPTLPTQLNFNIESFLQRPPNILIFGLMRCGKGFEQGIELAQHLAKEKRISSRVIFAGKPHDLSIARKIVAAKWDGKIKITDLSLTGTSQKLTDYTERYKKNCAFEDIKEILKIHLEKGEIAKEIIENIIAQNKLSDVLARLIKIYKEKVFDKNTIESLKNKISSIQKIVLPEQLREKYQREFLIEKYESLLNERLEESLPIEIHFDVSSQKLDELSNECKYCIKIEEKGFANNSSSIINALCRGLILFSNSGDITSEDFKVKGCYEDALILDKLEVDDIIMEIIKREGDKDQSQNAFTLKKLNLSIGNLFNEHKISSDHMNIYQTLINKQKLKEDERIL